MRPGGNLSSRTLTCTGGNVRLPPPPRCGLTALVPPPNRFTRLRYVHMEEMLENIAGARQVLERWMQWEPDHQGWRTYINLEVRYGEIDRARGVFEKYVVCHPTVKAWVHYAKFEVQQGNVPGARAIYERAVEALGEEGHNVDLLRKFARFEEHCSEFDRARAIYKYALDNINRAEAEVLFEEYNRFEKRRGAREGIEEAITSKRRFEYEEAVAQRPQHYDGWFDYLRAEEEGGLDPARVRGIYERAVAQVPPAGSRGEPEKDLWRRYIYLWVKYALFEELDMKDAVRAREVLRKCLEILPHRAFTFAKIWLLAAKLEVRQHDLPAARRLLGAALGMCPKEKLFREYVALELQMGQVDRCRKIYEKFVQWGPGRSRTWCRWAELEANLGEAERVRALFEIAVAQPGLDAPEVLWKAAIDFEVGEGERTRARALYERLLRKTQHPKVWMSFAKFEAAALHELAGAGSGTSAPLPEGAIEGEEGDGGCAGREARARAVYRRAFQALREGQPEAKEEGMALLEAWAAFEEGAGEGEGAGSSSRAERVAEVRGKFPRRVKRRRAIVTEDGAPAGMEEYYDYIFPDEAGAQPHLKLLEAAYRWKKQRAAPAGTEAAAVEGGG